MNRSFGAYSIAVLILLSFSSFYELDKENQKLVTFGRTATAERRAEIHSYIYSYFLFSCPKDNSAFYFLLLSGLGYLKTKRYVYFEIESDNLCRPIEWEPLKHKLTSDFSFSWVSLISESIHCAVSLDMQNQTDLLIPSHSV